MGLYSKSEKKPTFPIKPVMREADSYAETKKQHKYLFTVGPDTDDLLNIYVGRNCLGAMVCIKEFSKEFIKDVRKLIL